MWPFKKQKSIEDINIDEHKWSIIQAKIESEQYLVRINTTASEWYAHPKLSLKIGFAVPCDPQNDAEHLNLIEDSIGKIILDKFICIPVLVITGEKFREFVYYASSGVNDNEFIGSIHHNVKDKFKNFDIQCVAEIDKKWLAYNAFR